MTEERQFLITWSLLTGAGSIAGVTLLSLAFNTFDIPIRDDATDTIDLTLSYILVSLFVYAIPGTTIGLGQWFELRHLIPRAGLWVLASAVGWVLGFGLANFIFAFISSLPVLLLLIAPWLFIGSVAGSIQWLILNRSWPNSARWIPVSALATITGGLGWFAADVCGGAVGWVLAGLLTGYTLMKIREGANQE